jgi:BirA family transcriptional regulator, biotin operon repressor / biotin---[acetyl-CoA-carboxylase] ligase
MNILWRAEVFNTLGSTQDYIIEHAKAGAQEGLIVRAKQQTKGRGRHGRVWEHGEGNLYTSFLLRPLCKASELGQISLLMGMSLHQTIQSAIPPEVTPRIILKWPNDILIDGKKCAGILMESHIGQSGSVEWLCIGFGVNVCFAPLDTACHLGQYSKEPLSTDVFQNSVIEAFSKNYAQAQIHGFQSMKAEILSRMSTQGEKILVKLGQREECGLFSGIDDDGALLLMQAEHNNSQIKRITAGEIFLSHE